jgi:hypothetical protein
MIKRGCAVFVCGLFLSACLKPLPVVVRGPGDGFAPCGPQLCRDGNLFFGTVVEKDDQGRVRVSDPYFRGLLSGQSRAFYASGKIRWTRDYRNGKKDGVHVGWWENGRKMFEYRFRKDLYDGSVREWYADGKIAKEMHYEYGVESGLQRAWRENGTLYANYEARNGRLYGIINARLCYSVKEGRGVYTKKR